MPPLPFLPLQGLWTSNSPLGLLKPLRLPLHPLPKAKSSGLIFCSICESSWRRYGSTRKELAGTVRYTLLRCSVQSSFVQCAVQYTAHCWGQVHCALDLAPWALFTKIRTEQCGVKVYYFVTSFLELLTHSWERNFVLAAVPAGLCCVPSPLLFFPPAFLPETKKELGSLRGDLQHLRKVRGMYCTV